MSRHDLDLTLDLAAAQRSAARVRDMLTGLRNRFDLSPFEYTRQVRIAPLEIPHSHPVLTLNSFARDEIGLVTTYLHEQMHWYLTWYSHAHAARWTALLATLQARYPDAPVGTPEATPDRYSVDLHLVVNWLEIDVAARFLERDRVIAHARALPFYRWMYRTVIADWDALGALYADHEVVPLRYATDMSVEDLRLAALGTGAPDRGFQSPNWLSPG
jgi:hypothetical protein